MSLRGVATENLAICEAGHYVAPSGRVVDVRTVFHCAVSGTVLYAPDEVVSPASARSGTTHIEVTGESTGEAGFRLVVGEGLDDVVAPLLSGALIVRGGQAVQRGVRCDTPPPRPPVASARLTDRPFRDVSPRAVWTVGRAGHI